MSYQRVHENPNIMREGKPWSADHWKVTLRCQRRQFTTYFSKGHGHGGVAPTADEVLECLASDSAGYDCARSFEDWAADYGYDPDSRTAEKTYKIIGKQTKAIKRLLGVVYYDALLYHASHNEDDVGTFEEDENAN